MLSHKSKFWKSEVQVLTRQVLEFWSSTFLKTLDPHQPPPPFGCGGGLVIVWASVGAVR